MKKYEKVAEEILTDIRANLYHKKLPTEQFLAGNYGVSRDTLRKALLLLKEQGYVSSQQGSGYFIKNPHKREIKNFLNKHSTITEIVKNANLQVGETDNKLSKTTTNEFEPYFEGLRHFYILDRIRTAHGEPVVFSRCVIPVKYVGDQFSIDYRYGSLNDYLVKVCAIQITESISQIEAYQPHIDTIPAVLRPYPLIKLTQQNKTKSGVNVLLTFDYIRTDVIHIYIKRTKDYESE